MPILIPRTYAAEGETVGQRVRSEGLRNRFTQRDTGSEVVNCPPLWGPICMPTLSA